MDKYTEEKLLDIAGNFVLEGTPLNVSRLGDGFINDTYIINTDGTARKYLLQRKNSNIFKDIPGMMNNIALVTRHLKSKIIATGGDPERESLTIIPAEDGKLYFKTADGEYWCVSIFIEGSANSRVVASV